jgi:hypothetical protein
MSGVGVALADIQDVAIYANVSVASNAGVGTITSMNIYAEGAQNPSSATYQTPATEWWYLYDLYVTAAPTNSGDQQLQIVKGGIAQLLQPNLANMVFSNQNRFKMSTPIKFAPGERMSFNSVVLVSVAHPSKSALFLKFKRRPVSIPEKMLVGTFRA